MLDEHAATASRARARRTPHATTAGRAIASRTRYAERVPFAVFTRDAVDTYVLPGLEIVALPLTRSEPPPDPDALARAL